MSQRILFIDRDGTIIQEPADYQIDSYEKLRFVPGVLPALKALREAGWKLVMVTNQDGLGTERFPENTFQGPHDLMMQILESQGAHFDEVLICPHFPEDNCTCRKPHTGLVEKYLVEGILDREHCYVIGDRETDLILAKNMGINGFRLASNTPVGSMDPNCVTWDEIADRLLAGADQLRYAKVERNTKETQVSVSVWLDRTGENQIKTGIGFFDHMLEQIAVHGGIRLHIRALGDLHIDDHHTVEDVGLTLGQALKEALGDKRGIGRFGFVLPMDETLAQCALDISGRPYLTYEANFKYRQVGELSTEMVEHFFRSLAQTMGITLNLKANGSNDHHIAEGLFKAFGRTLRQAIRVQGAELPSSKGVL